MADIKRIGVLTSGGDCAGLNAVISAVVNRAVGNYGWEVYGILDGTDGLTHRPLRYRKLTLEDFQGPWMRLGGSMLGSLNTGVKEQSADELAKNFEEGVKELQLDAIVVIGGDGSMKIVSNYCKKAGVKMVGVPKTIDNDTPITEHSVGFATAIEVCVDALDRLQTTASSHHRALILEVMGRDTGHLAMHSAIAGGADVCLVPEIPYEIDGIVNKLNTVRNQGKDYALIVVSEGVKTETGEAITNAKNKVGEAINGGIGKYLCSELSEKLPDFQTRVTTLGHIQRGGIPCAFDRLAAAVFGTKAVDLLGEGKSDRMVAWEDKSVIDVDIDDVLKVGTAHLNPKDAIVEAARGLGIYVGK